MEPQDAPNANVKNFLDNYSIPQASYTREDQKGSYGKCEGMLKDWPLHKAAMYGDVKKIEELVKSGISPNQKMTSWYDSEPLGWSCSFGHLAATVKLVQLGAEPDNVNKAGNDAKKDAAREGYQAVVDFIDAYNKVRNVVDPEALRLMIVNGKDFSMMSAAGVGQIEFGEDGSFYNHASEMGGEWHVDIDTASDADGPKLNLTYPENNMEATYAISKHIKSGLFKGGIELRCINSTGKLLNDTTIKSGASVPLNKLAYATGGKGLKVHAHKDHVGGHDVLWAVECPASEAMSVFIEDVGNGCYFRLADRDGHSFDCAMAKYHENNDVPIYHNHRGENQLFLCNDDGTISPKPAPAMVLGYTQGGEEHKRVKLVKKGDARQMKFDFKK